ncbi:FG-GAP-like repeat-containing protein [Terriglobus roseus]|uniref:FG-GAP-like repeat-containing protein n=1 Tax=Terriglobus roseus TaxID=392734 RepID=UPI001BB04973|nr:FG-GAP-like repeat-containing protein [Terriglobus roseus]
MQGKAQTTTIFTLSSPGTIAAGTTETLTAQVTDSSNNTIPRGLVRFYDGARLIGTGQIITNGSGPVGRAVIRTRFGAGSHALTAKFAGFTGLGSMSQSVVQMLAVTPSSNPSVPPTYAFSLTRQDYPANQTPPYTLTAKITANTLSIPAGSVTFQDLYGPNGPTPSAIGTVPLVAGPSQNLNYVQGTTPIPNTSLSLFDFNNDGAPDLLSIKSSSNSSSKVLSLALGNGDGTFKAPVAVLTSDSGSPMVADFNADGNFDVIESNILLLGKGDGTFTQTQLPNGSSAAITGDYDHDGNADYAFFSGGSVSLAFGNGDGTFRQPFLSAGSLNTQFPFGNFATADFNGDGIDDIVASTFNNVPNLLVLLSNGDRTFQPFKPVPHDGLNPDNIIPADFNGDGVTDLAYIPTISARPTGATTALFVNLGVGDGTFQPALDVTAGSYAPSAFAIGDFNGDGKLDFSVYSGPGTVFFLFGDGSGKFAADPSIGPFTLTSSGGEVASADLKSDGLLDVVTGSSTLLASATSTATATLSNVMLPGAGQHVFSALYSPDGLTNLTSNTVTLRSDILSTSSDGFTPALGLHLNGSAAFNGNKLRLTDGKQYEAGSAWSPEPLYMGSFTTSFDFQITDPEADGFTLTFQNAAPTALGSAGGELGYNFIPSSVALKFDLFDNRGEGANSIGVYTAGNTLTGPGMVLPSSVSLLTGHIMRADVAYDGYTLNLLLTDMATGASASYRNVMDIPGSIGANRAYVGFTGATGGLTSTIEILNWSYKPGTVSIDTAARFENVGLLLNGTAYIQGGTALSLTQNVQTVPTAQNKAASVWTPSPFDINSFHSTFTFTNDSLGNEPADGFTFALQRSSSSAIGYFGGELGFYLIPNSVALKFDFFDNNGEGANSTGLYPAGVSLTDPTYSVPTNVNILNALHVKADIVYDGTTLTLVLTDPQSGATSTWSKVVNLPAMLGGNTAFYGFTAGTGQLTTALTIESWKLVVGSAQ